MTGLVNLFSGILFMYGSWITVSNISATWPRLFRVMIRPTPYPLPFITKQKISPAFMLRKAVFVFYSNKKIEEHSSIISFKASGLHVEIVFKFAC